MRDNLALTLELTVLIELPTVISKIPPTVAFQWNLNTSTALALADLYFLGLIRHVPNMLTVIWEKEKKKRLS